MDFRLQSSILRLLSVCSVITRRSCGQMRVRSESERNAHTLTAFASNDTKEENKVHR